MFTVTLQKTVTTNNERNKPILKWLFPVPHLLAHSPPPPPRLTPSAPLCTGTLPLAHSHSGPLLRCLPVTPPPEPLSPHSSAAVMTTSNYYLPPGSSPSTKIITPLRAGLCLIHPRTRTGQPSAQPKVGAWCLTAGTPPTSGLGQCDERGGTGTEGERHCS